MRKIGQDKFLHAGVCFLATVVVAVSMFFLGEAGAILCGAWFALGLGLGKEYGDSKAQGNRWDWMDIVADAIGILVAVGIVLLVYNLIK